MHIRRTQSGARKYVQGCSEAVARHTGNRGVSLHNWSVHNVAKGVCLRQRTAHGLAQQQDADDSGRGVYRNTHLARPKHQARDTGAHGGKERGITLRCSTELRV